MKRLFKLLMWGTVLAGWPLALSALHVVRTPGQLPLIGSAAADWGTVRVITKERLGFKSTLADTRAWTLADIAARPALAARLQEAGQGDALAAAGTSDEIAAALRGELPAAPAVPTPTLVPVVPEENKPIKIGVGQPVELKKPTAPAPTPGPTTQPKPTIFDF